jgi:ribonuclease HI
VLALPKQQQALVAVTLWDWWTARNKINAGEKRKTTEEICHLIIKHHHEFSPEPKALVEVQPVQSKWEPPPSGFVKVNFDASFIPELKNGSYGYVIRAEDGEFLAAGAGKLNHLRSALHGEAEACIAAMEGTSNLGMFRVLFESDSTTLIEAINNGNYDLADTGVLMREARSLKFLHFDNAEFTYCRRDCNNVAHTLAQVGYQGSASSSSWVDTAPVCVIELLASDLAVQFV